MPNDESKKNWVPTYHVVCKTCAGGDPKAGFVSGGRGSVADGEPEKQLHEQLNPGHRVSVIAGDLVPPRPNWPY
jgi:hypothetical protein